MMKRIIYIIIVTATFFSSCISLDKDPLNDLSDGTFWKTEGDATLAINGCYSGWESMSLTWNDGITDNAYSQFSWDGYQIIGQGDHSAANYGTSYWTYSTIQRVNELLEKIDDVDMSDDLRNRYKAEARALRAYKYMIMTLYYGDVPLVLKTIQPNETHIARTPKKEVQDFIIKEFDEVSKILPSSYSSGEKGRFTKWAALGLKARFELFLGKYKEASESADEIITSGNFSLFNPNNTPSDYEEMFWPENENNSEVLLDVQYMKNVNQNYTYVYHSPNSDGGWSSIAPTQSLVDAYYCTDGKSIQDSPLYNVDKPFENRDPRLASTVLYTGNKWKGKFFNTIEPSSKDYYQTVNASKTGYNLKKHMWPDATADDQYNGGTNFIVMRYAEILLIYAEAKIELGQIDGTVTDAISDVRTRAGMPAVTTMDQAQLRTIIRNERRVELAMEGLRWYDIQRYQIGEQVLKGTVYGTRLGTMDPNTGEVTLVGDHVVVEQRHFNSAKNYLWPIPQQELDLNTSINENNPGY